MRKLIFILILPFLIAGCKNQAAIDQQAIENYISAHHLNAVAEPGGLYFVPTLTGSGGFPNAGSTVEVSYKGYLTNDSVFDSSNYFTTPLSETIPGWQEGIPFIQKGGSGTILIPSSLGYGGSAQPAQSGYSTGIPANSVIIFDVHLISFQ